MAIPMTTIEKQINADLKELNSEKQFTELEFRTNPNAIKLLAMYEPNYVSDLDPYESIFELDSLLCKVAGSQDLDQIEINVSTANALGLTKKKLIKKIAHPDYREKCGVANTCGSCGSVYDMSDLDMKLKKWKWYCQLVEQYIDYMNEYLPKGKDTAPSKKHIASLKVLSEVPFIKNIQLDGFLYFYNTYGKNSRKKAKADFLLDLHMPNITDYDTALEVVEDSVHTNKMI